MHDLPIRVRRAATLAATAFWIAALGAQSPQQPTETREQRFVTDRESEVELALTDEEPMFQFAVFGDRTGGPPEGIAILAQAVADTNLSEPDLVMTVGDLINGYNTTPEWMRQMVEYKTTMDALKSPWYPVAGNHDVYWRGPNRPPLEHEGNYETHFGPLWYAFEHKDCWFVALFSDETNPETGRKDFGNADNHRMSDAQLAFLDGVLERTKGAKHVFVFLHHPRWFGGRYGDHWDKVHERLVAAGNVSAVFAGHVHRIRYDQKDGIEYFTLATVGGGNSLRVPRAGNLHHYNLVTVRDRGIAVVTIPVGAPIDHRSLTEDVTRAASQLADLTPGFDRPIAMTDDFGADTEIVVTVENPSERDAEITLVPDSGDPRWRFVPDHAHTRLGPRESHTFRMRALRSPAPLDAAFDLPRLRVASHLLTDTARIEIPAHDVEIPIDVQLTAPTRPEFETALLVDGDGDHAIVPAADLDLPDGPMTVEAWFLARSYGDRVGLMTKAESSDYGIFVSAGRPLWTTHVGGSYRDTTDPDFQLRTGDWHHVAGVFDGAESRLYVDGRRVASVEAAGPRRRNDLPFLVGADVGRGGSGNSFFHGLIDEVRISTTARYAGDSFEPARRFETDADTALLLHMDGRIGPYLFDSARGVRVRMAGDATVVPSPER